MPEHANTANKADLPGPVAESSDSGSDNSSILSLTDSPAIPEKSYELRVFQSLRRIIRAIEQHSRKLATDYQVTGPQLICLLALQEEAPLTVKRLAQSAYLSPSTVVGIVDRLIEKKLVQRSRSTSDRRSVKITVTEKGQQLLANAPSPIQESLSRALQELPDLERVSITLALEKVVELMEAGDLDAASLLETGRLTGSFEKPR